MSRVEFLKSLEFTKVNIEILKQITNVYGSDVPLEIIKIFSSNTSPELFDENESRTLSLAEVLNAEENNHVPFKSKHIIPIIDCGSNDFIVFDIINRKWFVYNILDETMFGESDSFEKLFLR